MGKYIMYLRKSRSDADYAGGNETDVLKRHESQLFKLAEQMKIPAKDIDVYREIVSADTIKQRPEMQRLLARIEQGDIDGVLVVEVQRLARGDTLDQGIVARTFKLTNTLIITLNKVYDPNNAFDEDFFEFGLFMSRRELKITKERLNRGRLQSVLEGKFVASHTPFGYDKEKLKGEKGYKLIPNQDADTVKLIFNLYTSDNLGTQEIAGKLNSLGLKPQAGDRFTPSVIRNILQNPVYNGILVWNRRKGVQTIENGEIKESHPWAEDYVTAKGLHEPLISDEQWQTAQKLKESRKRNCCPKQLKLKNQFASLIVCPECGRKMQLQINRGQYKYLICYTIGCKNVSCRYEYIEDRLIQELQTELRRCERYVSDYEEEHKKQISMTELELSEIAVQIAKAQKQLQKICISYENDIYDTEVYIERSTAVKGEIARLKARKAELEDSEHTDYIAECLARIPKLRNTLRLYPVSNAEEKNVLLKDVIQKMTFFKPKAGRHNPADAKKFTLNVTYKTISK